jgi:ankyrin repeat protein
LLDFCLKADERRKDPSLFRYRSAFTPVFARGLPGLENRANLAMNYKYATDFDAWNHFADLYRLNVEKPLEKPGEEAIHKWSPLVYATISGNLPVVRYLLSQNANPNEVTAQITSDDIKFGGMDFSVLHWVMGCGNGQVGCDIFDQLLDAKADPYYLCYRKNYLFTKKAYFDPLSAAIRAQNVPMVRHYVSRVEPKFEARTSRLGLANDSLAVAQMNLDLVKLFMEKGAKFDCPTDLGTTAVTSAIAYPKSLLTQVDTRCLDLLVENKLFDLAELNTIFLQNYPSSLGKIGIQKMKFKMGVVYWLGKCGRLKNNNLLENLYRCHGGTALHMVVLRDKPQMLQWLIENKIDLSKRTRRGQTALELAKELCHSRCVAILEGDETAVSRYSANIGKY